MKVLVTGGGGFLGGEIVRQLRRRGHQVGSFSRGEYPDLASLGVAHLQGDLADEWAVTEVCRGYDLVVHTAAKAGIWGPPDAFYRTNVMGTTNVLKACRETGIRRLIYTSSPSVVFNGEDMEGVDESAPYPDHFKAEYPKTKAEAEKRVLEADGSRLATVALRPHLIWGPRDTHVVPALVERGKQGRLRRIKGPPRRVDFTYIEDAARAHLLAADHLEPGSAVAGRTFFITQDSPVELWDFINKILAAAGVPAVKKMVSYTAAYVAAVICEAAYRQLQLKGEPPLTRFLVDELATSHWYDISAAKRLLGYRPEVSMEEGLERLKEWLNK